MGKTKTKYPVQIKLEFIQVIAGDFLNPKQYTLKIDKSPLTYADLSKDCQQYMKEASVIKPALIELFFDDYQEPIDETFQMQIPKILNEFGGGLTFIVRSQIYILIEDINNQIKDIKSQIELIKQHLNELPTRQQLNTLWKSSIPELTQNQSSIAPMNSLQKSLDLGVLFSEPIFDDMKKKPALNPVDFRSQIHRLHTALKSSMKANINLRCEIATKQNLKHLIRYSAPKILHIICHGTSNGALQFQDDSRTVLGALQLIGTDQIRDNLKPYIQNLPEVVFINSCYSEKVGETFFRMGVNYVIAIDSEDTIEDQAAQIFSQHFYRNIFNGEKVRQAFNEAKQRVKIKHNSFGCCCRHSSKQKHKKNCRWMEMIKKRQDSEVIDDQERLDKHKLFHIPSELCKCELKHLNRHKQSCEWARQALFHINNDFRIPEGTDGVSFRFPKFKNEFPSYLPKDQLVICCCFNYQSPNLQHTQFRLPHSQSNKFKIFQSLQKHKREVVFDVSSMTGKQMYKQFNDFTAPQLVQAHQRIGSSIMGRQRQISEFMKRIKDLNQIVYMVYGPVGVGRTSFVLKCVAYIIQRRVFQFYFYIDLYGIRDRDIFRYKFNEITKFNYDGEIRLQKVKSKNIIIILDNADDFFQLEKQQLYQELNNLRQELHKSKVIITLKEETSTNFEFDKVHVEKFGLEPLGIQSATKLIFLKMRHAFDITVQYSEIDGLVRSNQALRYPKFIESLCQSFSTSKKKVKFADIKKKLEVILEGDGTGNNLIEQNIKYLKQKNEASYSLMLFMSQFSQGLSPEDFKMLGIYENKESSIHLPIDKNWQTVLATLFEKRQPVEQQLKQSPQTDTNFSDLSEFSNPILKSIHSNSLTYMEGFEQKQKQPQKEIIKGDSYFLEEVSENRYIVKRFIRDFIWKKYKSPQNYYMKFLFVGYMSVMLEFYFNWLIESKYIHEDLLEYSAVSEAGIFGFKDNMFNQNSIQNLTDSIRFYNTQRFQYKKMLSGHKGLVEKLRKSDPSVFIANHKQDFLNIYEKKWNLVFQYLNGLKENDQSKKKNSQVKACLNYLQDLIVFIPTAFKIAKVEVSLLKYIISKSINMLFKLEKCFENQNYQQNQKILAIHFKLRFMKASIDIEKTDQETLQNQLQFSKDANIMNLMNSIKDDKIVQYAKQYWNMEKNYIQMYKQLISRKDSQQYKSIADKSKMPFDKVKAMVGTSALCLTYS